MVAVTRQSERMSWMRRFRVRQKPGPTVQYEEEPGVFGEGGIFGPDAPEGEEGGGGIGVNNLLWRASLDTISFMPLISADPFGGVIIRQRQSSVTTATQ